MNAEYDVLIAGGGLVGATLAAALAPLPLRVAIVEAVPFGHHGQPSYDDRTTAVSWGGRRIFEGIGLWPQISPEATAIHHIHISDRGHFGMTRLHAEEMQVEALGYVVPNRVIGQALSDFLSRQARVRVFAPAKLESLQMEPDAAVATVRCGRTRCIRARLLVAADGVHSSIRAQLGIAAHSFDYGQSAIVCNVSVERPQSGTAFERFTDQGPLALLPMGGDRYALVWTVANHQVADVLAMNERAFLETTADRFNGRLGRFNETGTRQAYPLSLVWAASQWRGRAVIVGNAAHSLHPVAGQGFNLSLRDVAALAEVLAEGVSRGDPVGDGRQLAAYAQVRRRDQLATTVFTDLLTRVFANPLAAVGAARNAGLLALELSLSARHRFIRHNMGIAGRLPRLARGMAIAAASGPAEPVVQVDVSQTPGRPRLESRHETGL